MDKNIPTHFRTPKAPDTSANHPETAPPAEAHEPAHLPQFPLTSLSETGVITSSYHPETAPPAEAREPAHLPQFPLTSLSGTGYITSTCPTLEPRTFRRLEDLGFTPGEKIRRMMTSAFGGCAAYIIKGSVIVLRDATASQILVNKRPADAQPSPRQTGGERN